MSRILVLGAGMIVHDQIPASLLHLQRLGRLGEIEICCTRQESLDALRSAAFLRAFPGQTFGEP